MKRSFTFLTVAGVLACLLAVGPIWFWNNHWRTRQTSLELVGKIKHDLSSNDRATVEFFVRKRLRFPESARFGPMVAAVQNDVQVAVCGWVTFSRDEMGKEPRGDAPFFTNLLPGTDNVRFVRLGSWRTEYNAVMRICSNFPGFEGAAIIAH